MDPRRRPKGDYLTEQLHKAMVEKYSYEKANEATEDSCCVVAY